MTFKVRVHGLPTLAVLVGLASCSPASDEANSHGFAPAGAAGGIRVTVQDEAREVIYEQPSGGLPEGFPAGFPMPAGVIEQSNRLLVAGQPMWSVVVQTQASYAEAVAFFQAELPAAGWSVTGSREAEMDWGTIYSIGVDSPGETITGSVSIEAREGGAPVTISLSQNRQQESSPPRLP
jgi:hypothetical protein